MRKSTITAVSLAVCLLVADNAPAQSGLKRLADIIRSQRSGEDAADEAAAKQGAPGSAVTPLGTPERADREPGYLGLVVDDQEDRGRGVRVLQVLPGGPAEKAGIKVGDLITSLGGIRVRQMDEIGAILQQMRAGDVLDMEILRGDAARKLDVTFGSRTAPKTPLAPRPQTSERPNATPPAARSIGQGGPLGLLPAIPRFLQQSDDSALRATVDRLQARIDELEARVEQLERALSKKVKTGPEIHLVQPETEDKK